MKLDFFIGFLMGIKSFDVKAGWKFVSLSCLSGRNFVIFRCSYYLKRSDVSYMNNNNNK